MTKAPEQTRILVVEDEPSNAEIIEALLQTEGYRTDVAGDGPAALARARRNPPDLIVLDLIMPDMDGREVCRHVKADARTAHVPVLVVTGLTGLRDKEEALNAGADDDITKPVDPGDLWARIRSLLRVRHLSRELDRTLAYLQELEAARAAAPPSAAHGGESSGTPHRGVRPAGDAGAPRVLVVDDEPFFRQTYRRILEEAGYRVSEAAGAAEAYGAAGAGVDVILLDIMMPTISGLEALERLHQIAPDVPVIIVTAYQSAQHAIAALRGGAFDFIVKGMKNEMLLHSVARAVERHRLIRENRRLMEELRARLDAGLASPAA